MRQRPDDTANDSASQAANKRSGNSFFNSCCSFYGIGIVAVTKKIRILGRSCQDLIPARLQP